MDYSQYEPPVIDGMIDYGETHAQRRMDAMNAFIKTHTPDKKKVVEIRCQKRHRLAWVELTPEPVIMCWHQGKVDSAMKDLRSESGNKGINYDQKPYADFLNAGDDLDLEVQCNCGGVKVLDRQQIREAMAQGIRTLIV